VNAAWLQAQDYRTREVTVVLDELLAQPTDHYFQQRTAEDKAFLGHLFSGQLTVDG
jgi:hypothetical protein